MRTFEIFDKIINRELRPNKFDSDGKSLEEKISHLDISDKEFFEYLKFLDKEGQPYTFIVKEHSTDRIVINEKRNIEYNELIDINIPPPPDKKAEVYLDLIEFEYVRTELLIEEIIDNKSKTEIEESSLKFIFKVKKLWNELKHYTKLIKEDKQIDYTKSNDFVIIVIKEYLERIAYLLIDRLKPYLNENIIEEFYKHIFGERDRKFKEMDLLFERIKMRKELKIDKKFDELFEELTKAKTIEEKIFNEIDFWKNHKHEKIEGFSQDELDFISIGMIEHFESELNKARVTGWIRGNKIEIEKAERLYGYMKEILSEYNLGKKNNEDKKNLELNDFAKVVDDEIKFVNAIGPISEERNMDDFKPLWEELIEGNFDLKVLLRQFEQIGEDKEDDYIEYCVRRYRHRTIDEWMRYFGALKMADRIDSLNKQNLPADLEYTNSIRIANARFEESTLGQFTLQNLHSFEKKYVKKDYIVKLSTGQETINQKLDDVKLNGTQEESNHKIEKKTVPSKGLKNLGKTFCEKLIDQKVITSILTETKSEKAITELIIPEIEKEYILTLANKKSLHDYFRQGHLLIRKDKTGQLIVTDTYKRKNN